MPTKISCSNTTTAHCVARLSSNTNLNNFAEQLKWNRENIDRIIQVSLLRNCSSLTCPSSRPSSMLINEEWKGAPETVTTPLLVAMGTVPVWGKEWVGLGFPIAKVFKLVSIPSPDPAWAPTVRLCLLFFLATLSIVSSLCWYLSDIFCWSQGENDPL